MDVEAFLDRWNGTQVFPPEVLDPLLSVLDKMRGTLMPPEHIVDAIEAHEVKWWHPVLACTLYVLVGKLIQAVYKPTKDPKDFKVPAFVKPLSIFHNAFMTVFSGWTFLLLVSIIGPHFLNFNFDVVFSKDCSCLHRKDGPTRGLPMLLILFYWSKYYEFVDTWLIYLKGREPIFLQTYHHTGAAIGLAILAGVKCDVGYVFVLFNSFIHTIMYYYYFLTCFGIRPSWKAIMTQAQLIQFYTGVPLSLPNIGRSCYYKDGFISWKMIGLILIDLYVCYLVVLFRDFYVKTYTTKKAAKAVEPVHDKKND